MTGLLTVLLIVVLVTASFVLGVVVGIDHVEERRAQARFEEDEL